MDNSFETRLGKMQVLKNVDSNSPSVFVLFDYRTANTEAQFLRDHLSSIFGASGGRVGVVYADVDGLDGATRRVDLIQKCQVVVLLQTENTLLRPVCIAELYHATKTKKKLVGVSVNGRKPADISALLAAGTSAGYELEKLSSGALDLFNQLRVLMRLYKRQQR